jgi:type II secretion system protein C
MSKRKSKLGSFTKGLKDKTSGLFKKSAKPDGDDYDEEYEEEYEYEDDEFEDGEEEYEAEYDDDFAEETDPSFQQLTVDDIKKNQVKEGEAPPDLPPFNLDDDEDEEYSVDDDPIGHTNPSLNEFEAPKHGKAKDLKEKFGNLAFGLKSKFKGTFKGSTNKDFNLKSLKGPALEKAINRLRDINVDEIFDRFFSPQNRPQIHKSFMAALFILGAYFTGRMISGILTPVPTGKSPTTGTMLSLNQSDVTRQKLTQLRSNDLFQAPEEGKTPVIKDSPKKPDFKEVNICRESDKKSSLSLKLVNTVVLQDSVKSLASVQVRSKEQFLREGDNIPNLIEVGKITRQRLIFKNLKTRKCEFIETKEDKKRGTQKPITIVKNKVEGKKILDKAKENGITNEGNNFKIKKEVRARMLENISEVLTQARAVKIDNPDGSLSFRMQEIVPGSIYSQLNIQEGDVITGLNGKKITNMAELMNLFGQIDKVDHFELTLNRNGIEQNLEYDFE